MSQSEPINIHLTACTEADSWAMPNGANEQRHTLGIRLKPQHAAELEIDPLLTFRYDPETIELHGALVDGTSLHYSSDTELPFGEPGGMSDYERCKLDPLRYAGAQLESAIIGARYKADVAAGRLRSIVIVRSDGEFWCEAGEYPSQVSATTASNLICTIYHLANWKRRWPTPSIRFARPDEDADFVAYNAPDGDYCGFSEAAMVAAGGILLARLIETESRDDEFDS